jgi:hypothetical protein
MSHVFLLVLLLGGNKVGGQPMYFSSIQTCNWYASQLVKRYGNYGYSSMVPNEHKATAYCKPVYLDKTKTLVYDW